MNGKDFPAILGLTNKSSMWKHWQRFSCHPWTVEWQRFSCHPWTVEQKLYVRTLAKIFLPSLDWRTKALCGNIGKDFPAILGLMNKALRGNFGKDFLPSLDWRTKALHGNFGKDFPAILGLTNKSSTWELWQRFSCHPWTDEQKLYVGTLAKIFLPSLDWRTKALRGNFGKDFPAILGLTNKSSTWELWQRFSCHPWTDEQKLYVGTLAKIFLPSLDWRTKALRGNIGKDFPAILRLSNGKDFPAILGLTNKSSMWELWQRFSCHPWTDEQKLYVGTLAKIFLPSLDWQKKQKIFLPSLDWWMAKIFLPSLDWRTKALRGNIGKDFPAILGLSNGKDFPAILGLSNKSSMWEHWQRFSCHPWTDEQKLYVGTLAKIFLPSLDWRTKALRGNFGKDFPAILGLTNKSSTWELWQRFSCHPWTDEQKLYVGTLAKIFLPSLDWRTKALCEHWQRFSCHPWTDEWQRFSCHPWTDEQKLYVGTLAKIFLPSLDCLRTLAKIFLPSLDWRTKALWELWQRFSCHPWTDEQKLYVGTLAKIFLPSLDWQNKSSTWELWQRFSCHPWTDKQKLYMGNIGKDFPAILRLSNGKDFPAILGLSNKSSMWELWQRFSCHPWTDEQKLYVGTLAKIFLPSLDWRTKALCGNFGKDFPAILGLTNKSSTWELWQRFSCHPWTDEQKLYVGTLAKIFLPSLDWRTKALRGNFGKDFPAILGLTNKSSTWELWQRFSCHPWTDEQKLYVGTLAKIFLPSLDCRTKALRGNFGKDFPAILGLTNGKDFPAILGLWNKSSM